MHKEELISPQFFQRLTEAVSYSYSKLAPFRKDRYEFLREIAGKNYGTQGTADRRPLNMLDMAVSIVSEHLTPTNINTLVVTPYPQLQATATDLGMALDHLAKEVNLADTIEEVVKDMQLGMGIVKIGMVLPELDEVNGVLHDAGQPFVDPISLDDWVHDIQAHRVEEFRFMGNKYRMDLIDVRDNPLFDEEASRKLTAGDRSQGEDRAEDLSTGKEQFQQEVRDSVELWDIYLPREGIVVTFPCGTTAYEDILRVDFYEGPEGGPYEFFMGSKMPNNAMPNPLANNLYDLAISINVMFNKLFRQAENQKTIVAVDGKDADDAQRVVKAEDMEMVRVDSPETLKEMRFNGPDQPTFSLAMAARDLFSYSAGNLDAVGGLSPSSGTVGQDKLLTDASGNRMKRMAEKVSGSIGRVMKKLAWYLWYHPGIQIPFTKVHQATGVEIPVTWSDRSQEGDFLDYNVQFEVHSLKSQSPTERLASIGQVVGMYGQLMPLAMEQGVGIDVRQLFDLWGKYANLPELAKLFIHMEGNPNQREPVQPPGEQNSTRQYDRVVQPAQQSLPTAGQQVGAMAQPQPAMANG